METRERTVLVKLDCRHLEKLAGNVPVTDEMLTGMIEQFFDLYMSNEAEYKGDLPDVYAIKLREVSVVNEYDNIPTDYASVVEYLECCGVDLTPQNILEETRTRELENEGLTRSDAQGVVDCEVRNGTLKAD
jgi:hypothetical protein